ncbi:MAG: isochorismate synthase [Planctomycetota bacterium]
MNRGNLKVEGESQGSMAELAQALDELESHATEFPATVQIKVTGLDLWEWLNRCREIPRFVWSDRGSDEVWAGVGEAAVVSVDDATSAERVFSHCRELLGANRELKFFGGLSFDGSSSWQSLGAGRFVVPRLQLKDGYVTLAVMNEADIRQARLDLQEIGLDSMPFATTLSEPIETCYSPNFNGWQTRIDEALALIRSEAVEKLVLSRKTVLKFGHALDPILVAAKLKAATHDCFVFCFDSPSTGDADLNSRIAFVGATPERLFRRQQHHLDSEVIAGTRKRGATPEEDERLASELLHSDKDQREHDIVRKSIRQKLHKFVDHLSVDEHASLLRLARKQHLRSNVEGSLKPNVGDGMLLSRLHPTPAVGGYPTDNALPEIARIEPFNRGWYAAPIGWIGADTAEFAVAIRSGFVEGDTLSLYSGAGIVRGSEPAEEWQEVENKIQDFMNVLGQRETSR